MGLESADTIDLIVQAPDGKLLLIITDAGLTADDAERLHLLQTKLGAYGSYVASEEFTADYPGRSPATVVIRVVCRIAPTSQMQGIRGVKVSDLGLSIPVEFEVQP